MAHPRTTAAPPAIARTVPTAAAAGVAGNPLLTTHRASHRPTPSIVGHASVVAASPLAGGGWATTARARGGRNAIG